MIRDPLREPRFGDVFRHSASPRTTRVLYIRSLGPVVDDDWLGLALDSEFGFDQRVQQWIKLTAKSWEFVETITLHAYATGGVLPAMDFSGMSVGSVRAAMARLGAELS